LTYVEEGKSHPDNSNTHAITGSPTSDDITITRLEYITLLAKVSYYEKQLSSIVNLLDFYNKENTK